MKVQSATTTHPLESGSSNSISVIPASITIAPPAASVSPPAYQATLIATQSSSGLVMETVVPPTNLSKENQRRRDFFIQMRDAFARNLHQRNLRHPRPKIFKPDGVYVIDHPSQPYNYGFAASCYECMGCPEETLRASRPSNAGPPQSQGMPLSTKQFAARLALGVVGLYRDHLPIMTDESLRSLRAYFIDTMSTYIFNMGCGYEERMDHFKNIGTGTLYQLLMYDIALPTHTSMRLSTITGFNFSLRDLQSTGICTSYGAKYEPQSPSVKKRFDKLKLQADFPLYRWGSPDALDKRWIKTFYMNIRSLRGDSVDLNYEDGAMSFVQTDRGGEQSYNFESDFWKSAELFALEYLSSTEWGSLYKTQN